MRCRCRIAKRGSISPERSELRSRLYAGCVLAACQKTAPRAIFLLLFCLLSLVLSGCTWNRHYISATSQAIRVEAMDRFYMDLEEDAASGCRWYAKCTDPDIRVDIDHEPGTAEVTIRVSNGYDGPSTVLFTCKRRGKKEPVKTITITLYKRTGDCACWE